MSNRRKNSSDGTGAIAMVILIIFAMPIFGLWLMSQPNEKDKNTGKILTIFGSILWIVCFILPKLS